MFGHREDYNSPEYKAWRYATFARDRFECQLCHRRGQELNAHHIIRWADAPHLRFVVSNGITLCKQCHDHLVTGREDEFAPKFKEMIQLKKIQEVKKRQTKSGKKNGSSGKRANFNYKPRNPNIRF